MSLVSDGEPKLNTETVSVVLVNRGSTGQSDVPERHFTLDRTCPLVRIGRASKVQSKGFIPMRENAWFDNPVMSRAHAELSAVFDDAKSPKLYIQDVGSFHGTFRTPNDGRNQEIQIPVRQLVELTNGDILRFGTNIFRNNGAFPPCCVDLLIEDVKAMPEDKSPTSNHLTKRVTFTVPDADDMDDEDDNWAEPIVPDAHVGSSQTIASDVHNFDPVPAHSTGDSRAYAEIPLPKLSTVSTQAYIDLTSEPDDESDGQSSHSVSITGNAIVESISEDEEEDRFTSDGESEAALVLDEDSLDSDMNDASESESEFESSVSLSSLANDEDQSDNQSDARSDLDDEFEPFNENENTLIETSSCKDKDNEHSTVSEMALDGECRMGYICSPSQSDIYSDESEHQDEDAQSEEDGEEGVEDENISDLPSDASTCASPPESRDQLPSRKSPPPTDFQPVTSTYVSLSLPPLQGGFPSIMPQPENVSRARDPSPSDAALFKRHPTSCADCIPNEARAQILGERSGKPEYFAAREQNRAKMDQQSSTMPNLTDWYPMPSMMTDSEPPVPDKDVSPSTTTLHTDPVSPQKRRRGPVKVYPHIRPLVELSPWQASGARFINNPLPEELPSLDTEGAKKKCEPDMTSAYTYQQSKMQFSRADDSLLNGSRRQVLINDLLDHDQPKPTSSGDYRVALSTSPSHPRPEDMACQKPSSGSKRSFDDAFIEPIDNGSLEPVDSTLAIVETNDSVVQAVDEITLTSYKSPDSFGETVNQKEATREHPVLSVQLDNPRPSKKLRLAQAAACVALGGAAAFSLLVNTAPVF
ncbi:hypothetical protein F5Y16DRAFT_395144 [Xylariaceae sp. FL0255]|nr:hypothetical protein F5Y16DRAFT_395144 [Xylariaceae sp. FL0255]